MVCNGQNARNSVPRRIDQARDLYSNYTPTDWIHMFHVPLNGAYVKLLWIIKKKPLFPSASTEISSFSGGTNGAINIL